MEAADAANGPSGLRRVEVAFGQLYVSGLPSSFVHIVYASLMTTIRPTHCLCSKVTFLTTTLSPHFLSWAAGKASTKMPCVCLTPCCWRAAARTSLSSTSSSRPTGVRAWPPTRRSCAAACGRTAWRRTSCPSTRLSTRAARQACQRRQCSGSCGCRRRGWSLTSSRARCC